jgi:hypothetical protein
MTRKTYIFVGLIILWGIFGPASLKAQKPFSVARVHFEQNATDGDVEVVFEVNGHEGIAKLLVVSPDGRTVIDFTSPEKTALGIRQFRFESPEPKDIESLKSVYPEGVYTFTGATARGEKLQSKSTLSHKLPATTNFVNPKEDAEDVDIHNMEITWTPVDNLAACILYIELDDPELSFNVKIPGSASTFTIPDGFLLPGKEYQLGIGTVAESGNASFVETSFSTAGEE